VEEDIPPLLLSLYLSEITEIKVVEDLMTTISRFCNEYEFLSNFYPVLVCLHCSRGNQILSTLFQSANEGCVVYGCVENAFQAAKVLDPDQRIVFRHVTASKAKRLGRKVVLRGDWEKVKVQIMKELLRQKFSYPLLAQQLLDTGDAILVEGNDWHDTYWGVDAKTGLGANMLGVLLMSVRYELRISSGCHLQKTTSCGYRRD
jgi:ribA/ribD-fused uncharacterized protein